MASKRSSSKDSLVTISLATILLIAGFWLAFQFVEPAPSDTITISTGSKEGAYYAFAQKYKKSLAKQDIKLEIINSAGSAENINNLINQTVDTAFVQGGTYKEDSLESLGSLYYEPVWLFYRQGLNISRLTDLKGLKLAIGPEGSGTRQLAQLLLNDNELNADTVQLSNQSGSTAADSLLNGTLDAAFFIGSVQSTVIQQLINTPSIQLLSVQRAEAYRRTHPFLSKITLPEGIINFQKNIPAQDISLIAPTANLLINKDLHPALVFALLNAIKENHSQSGTFTSENHFPNGGNTTAPISEIADRYYKKGPPFLMRYLPFWTAVMIDRFVVMLIPLIALLIPLFKLVPPLYEWRISSRIYRWYEALHAVDEKIQQPNFDNEQRAFLIQELERILAEVSKVKAPLSHARQLYHLMAHIELVRGKIDRKVNEAQKQ